MDTLTRDLPPAPDLATPAPAPVPSSLGGVLACLASAAAFGVAPVFSRGVEAAGVNVVTMLAMRFGMASVVFLMLARRRGASFPRGRTLATCVVMGGLGYAFQSTLFFSALTYIDATLVALLLYLYPALVVGIAILLRRERADARTAVALVASLGGLTLLLGGLSGAGAGALTGIVMGLGAALVYALYITLATSVLAVTDVLAALAVITASASVTLVVFGSATGQLVAPTSGAVGWTALLALVSTVAAASLFLEGVRRIGASRASILSCVEPVVTAGVALALFGEVLTTPRVLGGVTVLAAVFILEARGVPGPSRPLPGLRGVLRRSRGQRVA